MRARANVGTLADSSGEVVGWGDNVAGQTTVPAGTFTAIAAGDAHSLGIKSDGTLAGWGDNNYGQTTVPAARVYGDRGRRLSQPGHPDGRHAGRLGRERLRPDHGPRRHVHGDRGGRYHSLGLKTDGTLAGWGWNDWGQTTVPTGTFTAVAAGYAFSLGIRTDGTLAGWGENGSGQTTVPGGTFTAIAGGFYHSLGIQSDGTLAGWGENGNGQTTVPAGTFTAVAAGAFHSLGIKSDGTLADWGWNEYGQTTVPAGAFVAIAAGYAHSLGLRARTNYDGDLLVSYMGAPYGPNGLKANLNRSITVAGDARIESRLFFYNNPVMNVAGKVTFAENGTTVGTGTIAAGGGLEILSGTLLLVRPELTLTRLAP